MVSWVKSKSKLFTQSSVVLSTFKSPTGFSRLRHPAIFSSRRNSGEVSWPLGLNLSLVWLIQWSDLTISCWLTGFNHLKSQPLPSIRDITFGSWPTSANAKSPDWPENAPFRSQPPLSPSMGRWLSNEPHTKSVASELKELERYYGFKSFPPQFSPSQVHRSSQTCHPIQNSIWTRGCLHSYPQHKSGWTPSLACRV